MTSSVSAVPGRSEPGRTPPTGTTPVTSATHPSRTLLGVVAAVYVVLSAAGIGLGLALTQASLFAGTRHWDNDVNRWFVHQRTGTLDSLTAVGSHLAETPTVIGLGLLVVGLVWWRRHDLYSIGVLVVGLVLEVTTFVTITLFVDRGRPPVHHLDAAPPTSSFPSGHTAAAVVLYVGLMIVVHRTWRRRAVTIASAVVLALVPVAVALSRLYRGMHHPTDVFVGAVMGAVALTVACVVVRAAIVRSGRPDPWREHERGHEEVSS
jgi:undecaprenyl-diphosphatase